MSLALSSVLATRQVFNETTAGGMQHKQSPQPSALQGGGLPLRSSTPVISTAAKVASTKSNNRAVCFPLLFAINFASLERL
jgi:hypothetical protein